MVDEDVPTSVTASELVSILRTLSPEQTSKTMKVPDPLVIFSEPKDSPKQKDFPTKLRIGSGSISGSSIFYSIKKSMRLKICIIHSQQY